MPSTRCAWSPQSLSHARNFPECDSTPTSTNTADPHGVSPRCTQHRLALLASRMVDDRHRPTPGPPTRPTQRPQFADADLANERHTALPIAQSLGLVEQRRSPQVRVLGQPLTHIRFEPIERIHLPRSPLPSDALTTKVRAHRLSVSSQMAGNSRNRPSPFPQSVYSPRIPPVPTSAVGLPLLAAVPSSQQLGEDPTHRLVFGVTGCVPVLLSSRVG